MYDVIVVGAGAAGLLAAGRAAECGARTLLLEKMNKPGRKLMITGNSRCNITNTAPLGEFIKHIGPDNRFIRSAFSKFFSKDIVHLLESQGTACIVEDGEFVFTQSGKAIEVVRSLVAWNEKLGVKLLCNTGIQDILCQNDLLQGLITKDNNTYKAACYIIACGGASYPATGSSGDGYKWLKTAGHKITPIRPALVPLETKGNTAQQLQGLTLPKAKIVVWVDGKKKTEQKGDMLFTHFGITGPLVHSLSRYVIDDIQKGRNVVFALDLLPDILDSDADKYLLQLLTNHAKKMFSNFIGMLLPPKMIAICLDQTGIPDNRIAGQVSSSERKKLRLWLKEFKLEIDSDRSFAEAMITSGGVSLDEIHPDTMKSKIIKNLFFAGEIMDLDADTGGYNLQIAFSTGYVAGENAAAYAMNARNS